MYSTLCLQSINQSKANSPEAKDTLWQCIKYIGNYSLGIIKACLAGFRKNMLNK